MGLVNNVHYSQRTFVTRIHKGLLYLFRISVYIMLKLHQYTLISFKTHSF